MGHVLRNAALWIRGIKNPAKAAYEFPIALYFENLIKNGCHEKLHEAVKWPVFKASLSAVFYKAKSHYLRGEYIDCQEALKQLLDKRKVQDEANYLLAKSFERQNNHAASIKLIQDLSRSSTRIKTWIHLSNLTKTIKEFEELKKSLNQAISEKRINASSKERARILANAAFRANAPEYALSAWRDYAEQLKKGQESTFTLRKHLSVKVDHKQALIDLKRILDNNHIEFFLISGTLLGAIRENKILSHDNDIDVGVWEKDLSQTLRDTITTSGFFEEVPNRSGSLLKVRHVNGAALDIFKHTVDGEHCYHEGVKIRWTNSLFSLKSYQFLGATFMIPTNPEKYLTENYGNWIKSVKNFDSAIDTKNASIINSNEMMAYLYSRLDSSMEQQKYRKILDDLIKQE